VDMKEFDEQIKRDNEVKKKNLESHDYYLPHLHATTQGKRARSLYSKVYFRRQEETFHEFILYVMQITLGEKWLNEQGDLPVEKQHFIYRSWENLKKWMKDNKDEKEKNLTGRYSGKVDGFTAWILALSYDLYILQNTNRLPKELLRRLKHYDQFQGARYEIAIASIFARAGFEIDFVDESEMGKKCEFFAHNKDAGTIIAVEAKSRHRQGILHMSGSCPPEKLKKGNISKLLHDALQKETKDCPYFIFIDMNTPLDPSRKTEEKRWFKDMIRIVGNKISSSEKDPSSENGVIITNYSYHYDETDPTIGGEFAFSIPLHTIHPIPKFLQDRILRIVSKYGQIPDLDLIAD
jgi:hypothetical protein